MPLMSFAEYARHRGVSKPAVTKAIQAGRISVVEHEGRRMIDQEIADTQWSANTQHEKLHIPTQRERAEGPAPVEDPAQESGATTYTRSRAVKEHYNARLAKLAFEEKSGKLVEAKKVQDTAFKIARIVRDAMLAIPDRLAGELAAESNQFKVHARLGEEIRKALSALKDELDGQATDTKNQT